MTRPGIRLVAVLAALVVVLGLDVLVLVEEAGTPEAVDPTTAPTPAATTSPATTPSPVPSSTPTETLAEQVRRVAGAVERLRRLGFTRAPDPTVLTPDELSARVRGELEEYSEAEADIDRRLLVALRAVDADLDLRETLLATYAGQVAGFYDPDTEEMVVGAFAPGEDSLEPLDELTLAHELEHALADQALELPDLADDTLTDDAGLALQSLVEGDATLLMQQYLLEEFSIGQQMSVLEQSLEVAGPAQQQLDGLPWVLQRSLLFPYTEGLTFVTSLYQSGGWAAVDAAYRDPPTSTAQVLFPDRYITGTAPQTVVLPDAPTAAWQEVRSTTLGAADLLMLFEAPGDNRSLALTEPLTLVEGWQGGEVRLWVDGQQTAVAIRLASATDELCQAVALWYERAVSDDVSVAAEPGERLVRDGSDQDAVVRCSDGQVAVGLGPTVDLARQLATD